MTHSLFLSWPPFSVPASEACVSLPLSLILFLIKASYLSVCRAESDRRKGARERDRTIVVGNNSMCVTAGEKGDEAVAYRRRIMREWVRECENGIAIDWWRPERHKHRKWIYIHNSFCARFDFWKGSRCVSVRTAASIVVQWFASLQMNMEQAQYVTLAGSFPTETDIQSIRHFSTALKDEGWRQRKEGLRVRMRDVVKVTKWQENSKTEGICRDCFDLEECKK